MIQRKKKICKNCNQHKFIYARGMCLDCDRLVNPDKHGGMKRTEFKQKAKEPSGELDLFNKIWDKRPHVCTFTGKPLEPKEWPNGQKNNRWVNQFMHILPKGQYPEWRLEEFNIVLGLPEVHDKQEQYPLFKSMHEKLKIRYNKLKREGKL